MFHVLIQTEGNARIGLGHLNRSLALAKALRKLKPRVRVSFLLPKGTYRDWIVQNRFAIVQALQKGEKGGMEAVRAAKRIQAHLLITDSYHLDGNYYETLRQEEPGLPVLAFDDFGEKKNFKVHGFINGGLAASFINYPPGLLSDSALGPAYFPLKEIFLKARPSKAVPAENRIAVIMGSSDPERQTARLIRLIRRLPAVKEILAIVGPLNPDYSNIKKMSRADRRIRVYRNPSQLPRLLKKTRLTVTAGGITCGELAYLGVPMAILNVADNQRLSSQAIEKARCGKNLGFYRNRPDAWLAKQIQKLLLDSKKLQSMSAHGRALINGRGSRALAKHVLGFLKRYHTDRFSERTVHREYERSSKAKREFAKVKWGSAEGMENRFHLGIQKINWLKVKNWLDIGSGTGSFLEIAEKKHPIDRFMGLDLSPALLRHSRSKKYAARKVKFLRQNFTQFKPSRTFDLVTAVGVLQKSSVPLRKAMAKMATLVRMGGQVFLTTKNKDWNCLKKPGFKAYAGHHWFTQKELREAAALAGLKIIRTGGFEPRTGDEIPAGKAHSVYLLLKRSR